MFYLLILFVLILILIALPIRKSKQSVDEKKAFINIYKQELEKLSNYNYPEQQYLELKNELDLQYANQINILEKQVFKDKRTSIPVSVFVLVLFFVSLLYYHYHYQHQVKNWDSFNQDYDSKIKSNFLDNNKLQSFTYDVFDSNSELNFNNDMRISYCFLLQKNILKDYPNDSEKLAILSECHLKTGYVTLATDAARRALKYDNNNADYSFLLAQSLSRQFGTINSEARQALRKTLSINPNHKQALLFIAIDAYQNNKLDVAKQSFERFRSLAKDEDATIVKIVDETLVKIDNQLNNKPNINENNDQSISEHSQNTNADIVKLNLNIKFSADLQNDLAKNLVPESNNLNSSKPLFIIVKDQNKQIILVKKVVINNLSDFQIKFSNKDEDLMQMNDISNFKSVYISARLSISEDVMPSSGDWESESKDFELDNIKNEQPVDIIINKLIP